MKDPARLREAARHFERSVEVDPDRYSSHANLAEVYARLVRPAACCAQRRASPRCDRRPG